jgi:hypothetical protein
LLIVSHVVNYQHDGRWFAYGPYAREIDIWADLFPQVVIAAPVRHEPPPGDLVPFDRSNIRMFPVKEAGGETLAAKIAQIVALPLMMTQLARAMSKADAIHVRCPGNLGLLGAMMAPLFSRNLIAKYAGQWNGYAGEPLTVRLQRAILGSPWWRGPVTVYGDWQNQAAHVVPFFTSMMTAQQVARATAHAANCRISAPLRVLFSGMLQPRKRVAALIDAVGIAIDRGLAVELTIVGDGPQRTALETQVCELGLTDVVRFTGALPFDEALRWYEWANCLVLPSRHSEGWPKVVAEGMCYGLICIAVSHGQIPDMLRNRGIVLSDGTSEEIAGALERIAGAPREFEAQARAAAAWARQYSLEGLRDALQRLLQERWQRPLPPSDMQPSVESTWHGPGN